MAAGDYELLARFDLSEEIGETGLGVDDLNGGYH
jgi:hypothetical protein